MIGPISQGDCYQPLLVIPLQGRKRRVHRTIKICTFVNPLFSSETLFLLVRVLCKSQVAQSSVSKVGCLNDQTLQKVFATFKKRHTYTNNHLKMIVSSFVNTELGTVFTTLHFLHNLQMGPTGVGVACQGQTLQLIRPIRKSRIKGSDVNTAPCSRH